MSAAPAVGALCLHGMSSGRMCIRRAGHDGSHLPLSLLGIPRQVNR